MIAALARFSRHSGLLFAFVAVASLIAAATAHAAEPEPFGFKPGSAGLDGSIATAAGPLDTQAGSHPSALTVAFALNVATDAEGLLHPIGGELRDFDLDLPPGLIGDPLAAPRCPRKQFENELCLPAAQVGSLNVTVGGAKPPGRTFTEFPIYSIVPPAGIPAQFGFDFQGIHVLIDSRVRTGTDYGIATHTDNIGNREVISAVVTIWGVPAASSHDPQRSCLSQGKGCSAGVPPTPLLTMPTSCAGPLAFDALASPWQDPALTSEASFYTHDPEGHRIGVEGCSALPFTPTIQATPEAHATDAPTGLNVDLHIPKAGLEEAEGLAEADLKEARVTLPAGLAVNPSSADGLAACTSAQIELHGPEPAQCPDAAKIGSVEVDTPLLEHPLPGAVYLAKQGDNPFHSLLAIYIAVDDPATGVVVKLAGHVEPNPETGQLQTTFSENPQLPFEDFKLDFFGGPRAALTTPPTCGEKTTTTDLTPWSAPEGEDAHPSSSFTLSEGPNGSRCAKAAAEEPNQPAFSAGTLSTQAGAYSPFVLHLSREDGSQPLKALNLTLPPGLTGKLAGVGECSDAQLKTAEESGGAEEKANPSCPASSEVGTVNVGAGSGTPYYVQGHAYLAGPYKGAPLSMAIITPALAGPFDLGTVVVRSALYVNPQTAQITVKSDPIPQILDGIPLDLRSIAVDISRNQFTLNPTDCDPLAFSGEAIGASSTAALTERFQVGACNALPFAPHLALSLKGKSARAGNPALKAILTMKPGEANIARAQVTLPHSEFVDNAHIGKVCTAREFAEGNTPGERCSPESIYGYAKAWSPLLEKPVEGPVYLKTPGHKLPDLLAALNGQIDVALEGKVDSGVGGGIRNTFEVVPDAPVTKFELSMKGGSKGLLENSENICGKPQHALAHFTAQSGKVDDFNPVIANSCKGARKHRKRRGSH